MINSTSNSLLASVSKKWLYTSFIIIASFIFSSEAQAQKTASGSITIENDKAPENTPFSATATSIFESGKYTYQLKGKLNSKIYFGPWQLPSALGIGKEDINNINYLVLGNPSGELDVFVNAPEKEFTAEVYNTNAKLVAKPKLIWHTESILQIYDRLNGLAVGKYFLVLKSSSVSDVIQFAKNSSVANGPEKLTNASITKLKNNGEYALASPKKDAQGEDNYSITWDKGFGVVAGNQNVELIEGDNNLILNVSILDKPYFTINGSIDEGSTGVAAWYVNDSKVQEVAIDNNNFSLTDIVSNFDKYNNVDDISGELRLNGTNFQSKTVQINLTDDNTGENTYNAGVIDVDLNQEENTAGDVAIATDLKGMPKLNTIITMTNMEVPDSTYTIATDEDYAIFKNIYVSNENNPTTYEVKVVDGRTDETFLPTTKYVNIYQDENREINGTKVIDLNEIPNEQDITVKVRDLETLTTQSGKDVYMFKSSDNSLLASDVSDANGETDFTIAGETQVYFKTDGVGDYKVTFGNYTSPKIDNISEMDTVLNVTSMKELIYRDGVQASADTVNMYKPLEHNTEILVDDGTGWRVYFPPATNRQLMVDHFKEVGEYLGLPNEIIDSDTGFTDPTPTMIANYNPYPQDRKMYDGQIGTNITNYGGTATTNQGKTLPNGNKIIFYTGQFNLGGLDWSDTDHEIGNTMGFRILGDWKTSRSASSSDNTTIKESKFDSAIMPFWINVGKVHYNSTDNQNRPIMYMYPTRIDEGK